MDEDHFLHLTDVGREVAEKIYERHCFFTEQLIAAGVDPKTAEADACRIEHIISDESFFAAERGSRTRTGPKLNNRDYPAPPDGERKKTVAGVGSFVRPLRKFILTAVFEYIKAAVLYALMKMTP